MLAPFAKKPLQLTLRGITTDDRDLSARRPVTLFYSYAEILNFDR
jgi:RNA 3'-terminal phosphate cyclase-like protein